MKFRILAKSRLDKNYDDLVEEDGDEEKEDQKETADGEMAIEETVKKADEAGKAKKDIEIENEGPVKPEAMLEEKPSKKDEEEEEVDEPDELDELDNMDDEDNKTEELDKQDAFERKLSLATPNEAQGNEEEAVKPKKKIIYTGRLQDSVDSFFALSIRKGWQGVAYLLLKNGFNLMEAIKDALNEGQFRYVLALMTKIQDETLRQIDQKQQNLFHVFAMRGGKAPVDITEKILDGLLMRGVDYKLQDYSGRTPLHYAADTGFIYLEDKLLEKGADCHGLDNNGDNILHLALKRNGLDIPRLNKYNRYKIDLNAKFNHHGRQVSPLHFIAEQGNQNLEKEILRLRADPNIEDDQGLTPLQKVFIRNSITLDRLKVYIQAKTNINKVFTLSYGHGKDETKKTYTLLIYAAEKGYSYFEDQLLINNADASIENSEGKTAFDIALAQISSELSLDRLQLYIRCRANLRKPVSVKIRGKVMKVSPILYLMNHPSRKEDLRILKELMDSGVSVNEGDSDGWTPIVYAIRRNLMPHLELFLTAHNLDRKMRDKQGKSPIHHVVNPMDYASFENIPMLNLLARFFDVNAADDRRKPPIYYAHFQDSGTMVKALLELRADDHKPAGELKRQATSIIAGVDWLEDVDYEADAEKYIAEQEEKKMDDLTVEKIPVDTSAHHRQNLEVVYNEESGPYSLYMTKVTILDSLILLIKLGRHCQRSLRRVLVL